MSKNIRTVGRKYVQWCIKIKLLRALSKRARSTLYLHISSLSLQYVSNATYLELEVHTE
jgi:hypothetical protein